MKITTTSTGAKIVKRYRGGRCYAAVFSSDTTDRQIRSQMMQGLATFYPYNESSAEFVWDNVRSGIHFKR